MVGAVCTSWPCLLDSVPHNDVLPGNIDMVLALSSQDLLFYSYFHTSFSNLCLTSLRSVLCFCYNFKHAHISTIHIG